jgi:hypothetical protein
MDASLCSLVCNDLFLQLQPEATLLCRGYNPSSQIAKEGRQNEIFYLCDVLNCNKHLSVNLFGCYFQSVSFFC